MPKEEEMAAEIATLKAEVAAAREARESCQASINRRLGNIETNVQDLYRMMNQRLPIWATTLIGLMGASIGYLVK